MAFKQYFGLAILFIINTINFLDRLSIASVLDNIKDYYHLTSFGGGFLSTCFIIGYMLTAPVFGYLGDIYSRKWLMIGGISFWCASAFACNYVPPEHYYLFFILRSLVGVGEASYSTIAPTIIGDLFKPAVRKNALTVFYLAIPIGSGMGFVLGRIALGFGDWTLIFKVTPAIGLAAIIALVFLEEPIRGESEVETDSLPNNSVKTDDSTFMEKVYYLAGIRSYVWGTIGFTCCLYAQGALSWWAVDFFVTAQGKDYKDSANIFFGVVVLTAGLIGVVLGGVLAKWLRKYDARADPLICAGGIFVAVPLTLFGLLCAKKVAALSWIFLFLAVTALSTNWAIISDMVLGVTLPNKRAFASAGQILVSHMFGDAASPFIVGFIRDVLYDALNDDHLAFLYALITTLVILAIGVPAFLYSARFYQKDVEDCKSALERRTDSDDIPRSREEANLTDFAAIP